MSVELKKLNEQVLILQKANVLNDLKIKQIEANSAMNEFKVSTLQEKIGDLKNAKS